MKKSTTAYKKLMSDCRTSMFDSVLLYTVSDVLSGASLIFLADSLGKFGNVAISGGIAWGFFDYLKIFLSVMMAVIVSPGIKFAADYRMLKQSLYHDRRVLSAFFQKNYEQATIFNEGEIQERMEDDITSMRIYWVVTRGNTLSFVALLGLTIWEIYTLRITIGLLVVFAFALMLKLILPRMIKNKLVLFDNAKKEYHLKRRILLNDFGCNMTFFKQFGLMPRLIDNLDMLYREYHARTEKKEIRIKTLNEVGQDFFEYASTLALLVAGAIYVALGRANAGQIVTIMGLVAVITMMFNLLTEAVSQWPLLRNVANRAVIFYEDPFSDLPEATDITDFLNIDISNLSYRYSEGKRSGENDEAKNVIKDFSLHINAGDRVIIKGANGGGKTTLIRLICGLVKDYRGKILINGKSIEKWKSESWRKMIAVSTQHSHIFNCGIKENVFFERYYDGADFSDFSKKDFNLAYLNDQNMSKTDILQLSGGEKQAISIARAIEKGAKVIILDEPFNHLDKEKREALINHLKTMDCTIIIVTHDLDLDNINEYRIVEL